LNDVDRLLAVLKTDGMIRISSADSQLMVSGMDKLKSVPGFNGNMVLYGSPEMKVLVEPVPGGDRVLRLFRSEDEADQFIQKRLEQFDRMWDGCGCKIDYDSLEAK
jgi:hypothetical protein